MDSSSIIAGWWAWLFLGIVTCIHAESMPEIGDMDAIGASAFSCEGKVIGGYYADVDSGCQMFHVCTLGQEGEIRDIKFLCLAGTIFDQETRVCERVDEVDCSASEQYYHLNLDLFGRHGLILPGEQNQGRKVPSGEAGHQQLVLSDGERIHQDNHHLGHQYASDLIYPYSTAFDPDYDDEDYEDDLVAIIQQEFQTGTTEPSTTTSTAAATTTTTTTTTPPPTTTTETVTTTTTSPPPTTTATTTTFGTTSELPRSAPPAPIGHFETGAPAVVHIVPQPDVASSNQSPVASGGLTTSPPSSPRPEYQPHHYVVRQEFSVTSITSYHPVSAPSTTTARPESSSTTPRSRSANQADEDEDVYELLGQIEADIPRIRNHNKLNGNVFVPRFRRQATQVARNRTRTRVGTDAANTRRSNRTRIATTSTTTTTTPEPIVEETIPLLPEQLVTVIDGNVESDSSFVAFNCVGRTMGGFYADVESGCRRFHICGLGKKNRVVTHSFFCGAGLLFDQGSLTCQDADKVNCSLAPSLYDRPVTPEPEEMDTFAFEKVKPAKG